jgi:hypothetical protein
MARGGLRPGAGRPKGTVARLDAAARKAVMESGTTPLDYLLAVLRGDTQPGGLRLEAAKAAAPYVHAKRSSVEVGGPGGGDLVVELVRFADPEIIAAPAPQITSEINRLKRGS